MKNNLLFALICLLASPVSGQLNPDLGHLITKRYIDSVGKEVVDISVPGKPPDTFRMPEFDNYSPTAVILSEVPGYNWSFGCSPTAAAMMAGYYDRTGFGNMYSGPTNSGFAPMDNSVWGTVVISGETRSQCPLSATRMGVDGRTTRGHVDDYWVAYLNSGPDPYITNGWAQHPYNDCTADYMKTSQSAFGLPDGATSFQYYSEGSPRSSTQDGLFGLKLFYESRGYVVTGYYNQLISGYNGNTLGFTFNQFRQEIDAGRPVLIQVTSHTMLGFGYDSVGNKIFLHDTWDYSTHEMTWGGTYSGLQHYGVSVVSLQPVPHIVITSPNGGELWQRGSTDTITWNDNLAENIRIELYKDGMVYDTIAVSAFSSGSYAWAIPPDLPNSANYRIKITSTVNDSLYDFSNGTFSIASVPVITTTPVSGLTHTSGFSGGTIVPDSSITVTARGVCYSTYPDPVLSVLRTTDGSGTGSFTSFFTGLYSDTVYYLRAYATTIYGTTYGNQISFSTLVAPTCGTLTVNHQVAGGVAPVNKTVTYGTVANMAGLPLKCWITSNLGSDHQATADDDATESSAGWYWQFNRKQGYRHDGTTRTPNTPWITIINEMLDWDIANDPCRLELGGNWHIPTATEWMQVDGNGNWNERKGAWNSDLKLHAAGDIESSTEELVGRGYGGLYWSKSNQFETIAYNLFFCPNFCGVTLTCSKASATSIRCIRDALLPTVTTTVVSNITPNTAIAGGQVTNDGGDPVTVRGVCWDISINPTIAGSHTSDSTGTGIFISHLTGLTPNTLYFARAYATNGVGTAYGDLVSFHSGFPCGSSMIISHVAGAVAPVTKTVNYGTVSNIPGEPAKCWITGNLGADHQATAINDDTEASAGWYWQFNRKQGYKHDGTNATPNTPWITSINENSDWLTTNDPCASELGFGWRIPTATEWINVDAGGGWTNKTGPWNSSLKMHGAGWLSTLGTLQGRGTTGEYWSNTQAVNTIGKDFYFTSSFCGISTFNKVTGLCFRCLRDTGTILTTPTVITTACTDIGVSGAVSGGNVTNTGGDTVNARGICWSASPVPTIADSHTANGSGPGAFMSTLTGLTPHTFYYVRAYATNDIGTAYGNEVGFYTACEGVSVNHQASGGVAPVDKTVNYTTITNIPGEPSKCWITSNLGADHPATAVNDATEASAGWYWQFNRKQGYKHDGTTRTPNTAWITSISENLNWEPANDPCAIELGCGWRLPTKTEWNNVDSTGNWTNKNAAWNSGLKLHAAGFLHYTSGSRNYIGSEGYYWCGNQNYNNTGWFLYIYGANSNVFYSYKSNSFSARCLRENGNTATIPTVSTAPVSGYAADFGTSGGNVMSEGGLGVITRGVCWSTSSNPTIVGNHTADGGGTGVFVSYLTGLTPNTLYYIRAYATNCLGTAYGNEVSFTTADSYCSSFTISHEAGLVAPVSKSVNYGAVTNIPGEPSKCWITSNLGADHPATAVNDATEASAGWYWQFNRKQGYKHDGTNRTPNTVWITSISENLNWETANDPCVLEIGNCWRLPTYTEWVNVDAGGNWTNWYGPWNSGLKLHTNGFLTNSSGLVSYRGIQGNYWSITNGSSAYGRNLIFGGGYAELGYSIKTAGFSIRCINDGSLLNNQTIRNQVLQNGQIHCYNALQTINVAGNGTTFMVQVGGSATMIAGQNILYHPGTSAMNGGSMHGYIAPGGPWCMAPALPAQTEGTPDVTLPDAASFRIYPNPTSALFTLELSQDPAGTPVRVEICNLLGEAVLKDEFRMGRICHYSLSDQKSGIYIVRIIQNGATGTGKVIRQ